MKYLKFVDMSSVDAKDHNKDAEVGAECVDLSEMNEIMADLNEWTKKEKDLDEEIKCLRESLNKEPVVTDKDIMEQLHMYNDMKDAAQVVLGSLARIEEVSFTELHRRYNLELSDGP